MSKLIIAALTALSLLALSAPASAWWVGRDGGIYCMNYWDVYGNYLGCY